jgi:uncharacterized OB-fold protein
MPEPGPDDLRAGSPHATFVAHCRRGELAYQVDRATGAPVFYPRVLAPGSGGELEWRISKGLGTVYATTAVQQRDAAAYNVALIDLDEGFRMMSQVEDLPAEAVRIGMRVLVRMVTPAGDEAPYPVFSPIPDPVG